MRLLVSSLARLLACSFVCSLACLIVGLWVSSFVRLCVRLFLCLFVCGFARLCDCHWSVCCVLGLFGFVFCVCLIRCAFGCLLVWLFM